MFSLRQAISSRNLSPRIEVLYACLAHRSLHELKPLGYLQHKLDTSIAIYTLHCSQHSSKFPLVLLKPTFHSNTANLCLLGNPSSNQPSRQHTSSLPPQLSLLPQPITRKSWTENKKPTKFSNLNFPFATQL